MACHDVTVCFCVRFFAADLPGGVRNREGGQRAAAWPMATGAVGRRRSLLCLAVLRDDGQRLLERVRRPADDRRAALHHRRRGSLLVRLLTSQSARERRGKSTLFQARGAPASSTYVKFRENMIIVFDCNSVTF